MKSRSYKDKIKTLAKAIIIVSAALTIAIIALQLSVLLVISSYILLYAII